MTDPIEGLMTIAEIAITIAGFSGLIAVFRPKENWSPQERFRLVNILFFCFGIVICSLFPIFSAEYFENKQDVWEVSCLLYALIYGVLVIRIVWITYRGEYVHTNPRISYPLTVIALGVIVIAMLAGLGLVIPASPSLLGLILMWGIVASGLFFILSLVALWDDRKE